MQESLSLRRVNNAANLLYSRSLSGSPLSNDHHLGCMKEAVGDRRAVATFLSAALSRCEKKDP